MATDISPHSTNHLASQRLVLCIVGKAGNSPRTKLPAWPTTTAGQRQREVTLPEAEEVSKPTHLSSLLSHMEELKVEDQQHDQRRVSCRVFSDYKSMAWKNGLGQSVELAVVPASPFLLLLRTGGLSISSSS